MKVPQLKKKLEIKTCHNIDWEDNYSWIHQKDILEVLKDKSKLDPEVKKYLEDENAYTDHHLKDTKDIQKKLFDEIKGRIKLEDESLPYKDHTYEYWTKTTAKGNYSIKLRKKIGSENIEEIWNGDKEKEKLKTEYFGVGDLEVSNNDKYLGYSLDLKGSEYYTIYLRDIKTNEIISKEITETSGSITFSLDDKYIFYSKLDENHRARKIYRHKIGDFDAEDKFNISANTSGTGDNRNLQAIIDLQNATANEQFSGGFQKQFTNAVSRLGAIVQSAKIGAEAAVSVREASIEAESAYSGVNLDTEAANLIQQQQAYQASARILSTARELFETLLQAV